MIREFIARVSEAMSVASVVPCCPGTAVFNLQRRASRRMIAAQNMLPVVIFRKEIFE
jgi:hypothetical protein